MKYLRFHLQKLSPHSNCWPFGETYLAKRRNNKMAKMSACI